MAAPAAPKEGAELARLVASMEGIDGRRQLHASAMVEYSAPLNAWLDEQTKGLKTGW